MKCLLDDMIMQKGQPVTAGSKMLQNFPSPINATVVDKLTENGYEIVGRISMGEFGITSAEIDFQADFILCNDLFGHYRKLAVDKGYFYIHPTYGTVSRYGLIPLDCSMDQIGVLCKDLRKGMALLDCISGNDPKDGAMLPSFDRTQKAPKVAQPRLEFSQAYKQVKYILNCAEISNNISRYDGVKFGYRAPDAKNLNELYIKSRSQGFGKHTKLTAITGTMLLTQDYYKPYYEKAMKIRRLIKESIHFDSYNIIQSEINELPQLAGLPSISFMHKGQATQLVANIKDENLLLSAWEEMA